MSTQQQETQSAVPNCMALTTGDLLGRHSCQVCFSQPQDSSRRKAHCEKTEDSGQPRNVDRSLPFQFYNLCMI